MISNRNSDYLKAHVEVETEGRFRRDVGTIPGPIVAEFADHHDAMLFRGMKGPNWHCITAGINQRFAVRRMLACAS